MRVQDGEPAMARPRSTENQRATSTGDVTVPAPTSDPPMPTVSTIVLSHRFSDRLSTTKLAAKTTALMAMIRRAEWRSTSRPRIGAATAMPMLMTMAPVLVSARVRPKASDTGRTKTP